MSWGEAKKCKKHRKNCIFSACASKSLEKTHIGKVHVQVHVHLHVQSTGAQSVGDKVHVQKCQHDSSEPSLSMVNGFKFFHCSTLLMALLLRLLLVELLVFQSNLVSFTRVCFSRKIEDVFKCNLFEKGTTESPAGPRKNHLTFHYIDWLLLIVIRIYRITVYYFSTPNQNVISIV